MRALALAVALALAGGQAHAQNDYQGQTAKEFFNNLSIPGLVPNCCNDADCKRTKADYINGQWIAESAKLRDDEVNPHPGEWVVIPPDRVTPRQSPFDSEAVICEGVVLTPDSADHPNVDLLTIPGGFHVFLFCFSPPPFGF